MTAVLAPGALVNGALSRGSVDGGRNPATLNGSG